MSDSRQMLKNNSEPGEQKLHLVSAHHIFLREEHGQAIVLGAIAMVALIAILGLAVDTGFMLAQQRKLQNAAESAALAGALEIPVCAGLSNCTALQAAGQSALVENGLNGSTLASSCTGTSGTGLTLTLNNPPCFTGSTDPNAGNTQFVEAIVSQTQPAIFAKMVGIASFPLRARAEAARTGNPNCIYALDQTGANAITVDALAIFSSSCGIVDESSSPNALSCNILASIQATQLKITGGTQSLLCSVYPRPLSGVPRPTPADPLAYLPTPAIPTCGTSTSSPYTGSATPLLLSGTATLYPGAAYCGGISILPGADVTFSPGTYIIRSGGLLGLQGGISIDLGANVNGTGVTIYNNGPSGGVSFVVTSATLGSVTLTAPTSGTYSGVLFAQNAQDTTAAVLIGSASLNSKLEGAFYFPSAHVTTALSGPARYNIVVALDVEIAALTFGSTTLNTTSFANNYSSLPSGSPLAGSGAVLVQ